MDLTGAYADAMGVSRREAADELDGMLVSYAGELATFDAARDEWRPTDGEFVEVGV